MLRRWIRKLKEKNRSLRSQTLFMFTSLLCLLAFTFLMASFVVSIRAESEYREETSQMAVNNVASNVVTSIDTYNYISRLIMVNERVVSFLQAEEANKSMSYEARMGMYEILNMYNNISYVESVYIFRKDMLYAHTGKGEYLIDENSAEWERILNEKGGKVVSVNGNGMMKKTDGTPSLTFARGIYDINSQKFLGYFVMNISQKNFDEVLRLQSASEILIVDKSGNFLCGNEELMAYFDESFCKDSLVQKMARYQGRRNCFVGTIAFDPLVVICCTSTGGDSVPVTTVIGMLLIFSLFLGSVLICAWYIRNNITKPILTLDDAMERTKSQGWMKTIEDEMPQNEIGRLAERYNSMIASLNDLFERIKQDEENIRRAEMSVLQEQIKPHFLYNTLGTISYIAVEENAMRAHKALETLGSFYRNFLSKGSREISFQRELDITRDYLALQKLRYGASYEDEYEIDERALEVQVPKLILQPLVENSIYHGVRPKGELCVIRVTAKMLEDGLHVSVYDTGVGMGEEQIRKILNHELADKNKQDVDMSKGGFGLVGTIDRIRYYCNRNDVVQIRSEEGEFTEIEFVLPREQQEGF